MKEKSMGFIGGGRVARIILGGLKKARRMPVQIVASDNDPDVLKKLQSGFPDIRIALNNNREAAAQDLVFLGLHPPALVNSLADIKADLKKDAILISLAPKLTLARLREGLGGFNRIGTNARRLGCRSGAHRGRLRGLRGHRGGHGPGPGPDLAAREEKEGSCTRTG